MLPGRNTRDQFKVDTSPRLSEGQVIADCLGEPSCAALKAMGLQSNQWRRMQEKIDLLHSRSQSSFPVPRARLQKRCRCSAM